MKPSISFELRPQRTTCFGSLFPKDNLKTLCCLEQGTRPHVKLDHDNVTPYHKKSIQSQFPKIESIAKSMSAVFATILLSTSPYVLDHANAADSTLRAPSKNPYDDLQPAGISYLGNKGPNLQVPHRRGIPSLVASHCASTAAGDPIAGRPSSSRIQRPPAEDHAARDFAPQVPPHRHRRRARPKRTAGPATSSQRFLRTDRRTGRQ